jgi:Fe-S cluster biogenesis protein NfuA
VIEDKKEIYFMLKQQVEKVIEEKIRPALMRDGGNIQLVDVTDEGVVQVKLQGACAGCPGAIMTLQFGVQKILQEEIKEVTKVVPV